MEEITILCCYNKEEDYKQFQKSLSGQNVPVRLIGIDNRNHAYTSCASAFNEMLQQVKTKYIIFAHQDIELPQSNLIETFLLGLTQIDEGDILGVAGRNTAGKVLTNILHGKDREPAGSVNLEFLEECETVDECFFGGTTQTFLKYPFDQRLCDDWHLYAVERSLAAKVRGNKVYVCGIALVHKSKGKINQIYNKQLYRLCKVYSKDINHIYTTCASSVTKSPQCEINFLKRTISIVLGRYGT